MLHEQTSENNADVPTLLKWKRNDAVSLGAYTERGIYNVQL